MEERLGIVNAQITSYNNANMEVVVPDTGKYQWEKGMEVSILGVELIVEEVSKVKGTEKFSSKSPDGIRLILKKK